MALSGPLNGDLFLLLKDGIEVAHTTSCTLSIGQNLIDTTTKSDCRNETHIRGNRSYELSAEGIVFFGASEGFYELAAMIIPGASATFRFVPYTDYSDKGGSASAGDYYYEGDFDLSSLTLDANNNEATTYSFDGKVSGSLTFATT